MSYITDAKPQVQPAEVLEVLKKCTIGNKVVKLPAGYLDRALYEQVAKVLKGLGGKWKGGAIAGFVFENDPTALLRSVVEGENLNLKKEYQFYATPDTLADQLVNLADIKEGQNVLEPSAGQGAILKAILRKELPLNLYWCELMPANRETLLNAVYGVSVGDNFLFYPAQGEYDRIIANPPFTKGQDIDHIRHMYAHLAPGGRLVSLASKFWLEGDFRKRREFRQWLLEVDAMRLDIGGGAFKDSGTMIETCIIVIDKK